MEGKGWFIIYGVLALVTVYLFIAQQSLNGNVKQLQADVAQLRTGQQTTEPVAEESPSAEPNPVETPDLSTAAGRDAKRKTDLKTINEALTKFYAEKNVFPKSLQELVPTYLAEALRDPLSPKYSYRYVKSGDGFRLTAYIEEDGDAEDRSSDGKADHIYLITEQTE